MSDQSQEIKHLSYIDIFFLGFTLIGVQIIFIREFLLLYSGNELVIGILLTIWLILTAAGAWLGRFFPIKFDYTNLVRILMVILTVYPLIAVFSIEYFRNDVFDFGRVPSLYEIIQYSVITLLPICFTGGLLFTIINISIKDGNGKLQNCYAIESFGSLVGGLIISLYFIYLLQVDNFRSLTYLLLINFLYFGIADFKQGKQSRSFVFLFSAIAFMFLIYYLNPGLIAKEKFFENQKLLLTKETPFGNLSVTETGNQLNYHENGVILFSEGNTIQREEDIHYAMLQKPDAKQVLLIGGGVSGTIAEIQKYMSVEQIIYLEINPEIIKLRNDLLILQEGTIVKSMAIDPIIFIKQANQQFDVIFINLPTPVSAQINRFYSVEFYQKIKRILDDNGLISTGLTSSQNYLSENELKLQASIYNSIKQVFKYTIIVQGDKNYFLGSDSALSFNYTERFSKLQAENSYVNSNYLNNDLLKYRSDKVLESYTGINTLNYDYKPSVYLSYIQHWMGYYGNNFWIIPIVCFLIIFLYFIFAKPMRLVMFTSGFAGAGVEIVLLVVFQVLVGYVYLFLGVIITLFMAGLSIGAFLSRKVKASDINKLTILIQLASAIFVLVVSLLIILMKDIVNVFVIQFLISCCLLITSILVGYQYGIAVAVKKEETGKIISAVYSADLVGSAIGSLLVAILLIPLLGLSETLYFLSFMHFLTLLFYLLKQKFKYL